MLNRKPSLQEEPSKHQFPCFLAVLAPRSAQERAVAEPVAAATAAAGVVTNSPQGSASDSPALSPHRNGEKGFSGCGCRALASICLRVPVLRGTIPGSLRVPCPHTPCRQSSLPGPPHAHPTRGDAQRSGASSLPLQSCELLAAHSTPTPRVGHGGKGSRPPEHPSTFIFSHFFTQESRRGRCGSQLSEGCFARKEESQPKISKSLGEIFPAKALGMVTKTEKNLSGLG